MVKKKNKNNNNLIIRTKNKISSNTDYLLIDANALIHPVTKLVVKNHFTNKRRNDLTPGLNIN